MKNGLTLTDEMFIGKTDEQIQETAKILALSLSQAQADEYLAFWSRVQGKIAATAFDENRDVAEKDFTGLATALRDATRGLVVNIPVSIIDEVRKARGLNTLADTLTADIATLEKALTARIAQVRKLEKSVKADEDKANLDAAQALVTDTNAQIASLKAHLEDAAQGNVKLFDVDLSLNIELTHEDGANVARVYMPRAESDRLSGILAGFLTDNGIVAPVVNEHAYNVQIKSGRDEYMLDVRLPGTRKARTSSGTPRDNTESTGARLGSVYTVKDAAGVVKSFANAANACRHIGLEFGGASAALTLCEDADVSQIVMVYAPAPKPQAECVKRGIAWSAIAPSYTKNDDGSVSIVEPANDEPNDEPNDEDLSDALASELQAAGIAPGDI